MSPVLRARRAGRRGWFVVVARSRGGRGVGVARSFSVARELACGPSWLSAAPP